MEVKNPLFNEETPVTPSGGDPSTQWCPQAGPTAQQLMALWTAHRSTASLPVAMLMTTSSSSLPWQPTSQWRRVPMLAGSEYLLGFHGEMGLGGEGIFLIRWGRVQGWDMYTFFRKFSFPLTAVCVGLHTLYPYLKSFPFSLTWQCIYCTVPKWQCYNVTVSHPNPTHTKCVSLYVIMAGFMIITVHDGCVYLKIMKSWILFVYTGTETRVKECNNFISFNVMKVNYCVKSFHWMYIFFRASVKEIVVYIASVNKTKYKYM